jgi:hypothetical protein
VNVLAALAGGFVGTVAISTLLQLGTELRLTRVDIPFLLGTAFTDERDEAKALGYALYAVMGVAFSLVYWAVFSALGEASWWLGGLFGILHGLFLGAVLLNIVLPALHPRMGSTSSAANDTSLIEPPGFMMLNYGPQSPLVSLVAHACYGAIVGWFIAAAG